MYISLIIIVYLHILRFLDFTSIPTDRMWSATWEHHFRFQLIPNSYFLRKGFHGNYTPATTHQFDLATNKHFLGKSNILIIKSPNQNTHQCPFMLKTHQNIHLGKFQTYFTKNKLSAEGDDFPYKNQMDKPNNTLRIKPSPPRPGWAA